MRKYFYPNLTTLLLTPVAWSRIMWAEFVGVFIVNSFVSRFMIKHRPSFYSFYPHKKRSVVGGGFTRHLLFVNLFYRHHRQAYSLLFTENFAHGKKLFFSWQQSLYRYTIFFRNDGWWFIRGLITVFLIDACVSDDEPLWEPLEWSLFQTWLFFIFLFAWIAENLITSRFGNYTGRDKRVWFGWYKAFWLIDAYFAITYGIASLFVIVPFYYEITYNISFIVSWWDWYSRVFFFKFISVYSLILFAAQLLQINTRWFNWKKLFVLVLLINFFISYLLYTHFIMSFFSYFTDPLWYQKSRFNDFIQLSHEPLKWGWGPAKRDHFTYHKVTTVFWFKNDTPFAGSFFLIHFFFFLSIFFLYIYWLVLLRRLYTTKEVTYTYTIYCVSALKQFYYFFFLMYIFVFISFIANYWRFPFEFLWVTNSFSWGSHFICVLQDYFSFCAALVSFVGFVIH